MALTPQDVSEKKFGSTRFNKGYDEAEVDAFLDQVEAELTRLIDENARLRAQLDAAQAAASAAPIEAGPPTVTAGQSEMEELLRRTLLLGQRTADEAVAEAKAEAERLRSEAYSEVESARAESDRRISEAERAAAIRHSALLAEQDAARRRLEDEIAALRGFESDFRGRLTSYLELQLRDLHSTELAPPGGPQAAYPSGSTPAVVTPPAGSATVTPPADAAPNGYPPEPSADVIDATTDDAVSVSAPVVPAQVSSPQPHTTGDHPSGGSPVLPALPPLPEWMSADAGFGTPTPPAPADDEGR